ncbi:MAG: peroxide stress protein YaaA [Alysiella sp.]|uniref:peroxide stress protein YaaA n=1 Tax=Alysiella sp. TaxID=1872483 RepID=UPI0026DB721C|nr:peroxide stress protein YaaA [Alysiella sp.]MDO4434441.1 peroxide stress protein YaaA [Alysiella sp.]
MYFLLSPAKNLNESRDIAPKIYSQPPLLDQAEILMQDVRPLSPQQIAELMHVSDKIALLNAERNATWQPPFTLENAKPALYMFNGDVYEGIDAYARKPEEISYIHNHVRILSGLYGILRPLDLIQAYRLEMGTPLINSRGKNLYEFWGERVTNRLNYTLGTSEDNLVINLASQEYFKVIQPAKLNAHIITPIFQDEKDGKYKVISFYAKRARGLMVRYAAQNQIENVEQLKNFDLEGYQYCEAASSENEWVFRRNNQTI